MSAARRAVTPIDVLHNCRGKAISVELVSGETVNGTVMRTDRAMNVILKQCIRTGTAGEAFWRVRECLVRGTSIRNIRMDESALRVATAAQVAAAKKRRTKSSTTEHNDKRGNAGAVHHKRTTKQPHREG